MSQMRVSVAAAMVVSGLVASAASAATVGPGLTWSGGNAYPLSPLFGGSAYVAVQFTLTTPFVPTSLQVVINQTSASAGSFKFDIVSEVSGSPDLSNVLGNFTLATTGSFSSSTQSPSLTTPAPTLAASTNYWLVGYAVSGTTGAWNRDNVNLPAGNVKYDFGIGALTDTVSPAFLMQGTTPIPLPGASLMGGAVLLGLLGRRTAGR